MESPGPPLIGHRPATVQRPRPSPAYSVLHPDACLLLAERHRGPRWLNPRSSLSVARLGRAAFSSGAASVGRGFRDEPPGAAGASSDCRGGSSSWNLLTLLGSEALEVMRLFQAIAAGSGS